jgi:hypothetical protein
MSSEMETVQPIATTAFTATAMETVQTEQKFTILYHGNCIDGWFSAYIAWTAIRSFGPVQMFPISPNQVRTWPTKQEMAGTHILMLDISVPQKYRDMWLKAGAQSILCIDHHRSSIEHWPESECPINVESCAALQTHQYFYPQTPCPGWLHAIDRIDRWDNVSYDDRCLREILSIIAHKPVRGDTQEAMALSMKFIHDMNNDQSVGGYLTEGKQILDQKDSTLTQIIRGGRLTIVNKEMITAWKLPESWHYLTIFILDNSNVSIDTTEAAHLLFLMQPGAAVFINYRKQQIAGKEYPQYIFSARSRGFDITDSTILKGHPSAAGAMVIAEPGATLPFVLA